MVIAGGERGIWIGLGAEARFDGRTTGAAGPVATENCPNAGDGTAGWRAMDM